MTAGRPNLVLIGAGNLATGLGKALFRCGYPILQVYSRTQEAARGLAECLSADYATSLEDVRNDADLYIVALKDSVLVERIADITSGKKDALFVHTAGSIPMDIWKGHAGRYGVFYPMQTFNKEREVDFSRIPIFLEAVHGQDLDILHTLASDLSSVVYELPSEKRRVLHLAAVFACNFSNHMYALAEGLLGRQGIPFDILLPLIEETTSKLHDLSPRLAQTGPAVRYDQNVIQAQLSLLSSEPSMQEIYRLLSESIHQMYKDTKEQL